MSGTLSHIPCVSTVDAAG